MISPSGTPPNCGAPPPTRRGNGCGHDKANEDVRADVRRKPGRRSMASGGMSSLGRAQPPRSTPRRRRERREEGLAEDRPALQAVAPILADRRAALPALAAGRGLVRLDDDELRILQLVPPRLASEEEREVVGPRLEFEEGEFPAREEFVDPLQEVAGVLEPDDLLLFPQDEPRLPQVQLLVQPRGILRGERQFERTESRVHLFQDRLELERLRYAEAE